MATTKLRLTKRAVEALPAPCVRLGYRPARVHGHCVAEGDGDLLRPAPRQVRRAAQGQDRACRICSAPTRRAREAEKLLAQLTLGTLERKVRPKPSPRGGRAGDARRVVERSAPPTAAAPNEAQQSCRSIWRCHLEPMAGKRLADISEALVEDLHGEVSRERGPVAANNAGTLLRTLLGHAERRGWIAVNPARRFTKNKVEPVQNDMTQAELARVVEILQSGGKPVDLCLLFMIATGARRGETLAMCWRDLDMTAGTWIKARRTTKGGRTQRLSLSDEALELLRASAARLARRDGVRPQPLGQRRGSALGSGAPRGGHSRREAARFAPCICDGLRAPGRAPDGDPRSARPCEREFRPSATRAPMTSSSAPRCSTLARR